MQTKPSLRGFLLAYSQTISVQVWQQDARELVNVLVFSLAEIALSCRYRRKAFHGSAKWSDACNCSHTTLTSEPKVGTVWMVRTRRVDCESGGTAAVHIDGMMCSCSHHELCKVRKCRPSRLDDTGCRCEIAKGTIRGRFTPRTTFHNHQQQAGSAFLADQCP